VVAFAAVAAVIEHAVEGGQQAAAGAVEVEEVEVGAGKAHAGSATRGEQGDDGDVEGGGQQRGGPRVQGPEPVGLRHAVDDLGAPAARRS
jgi:hypothetical protein